MLKLGLPLLTLHVILLVPSFSSVVSAAEVISTTIKGSPLAGKSKNPVMSADGRVVVFQNQLQIYKKDLKSGALTLVSTNTVDQPGDRESYIPHISSDGRFVTFESIARNLVGGALAEQVYLKDTQTQQLTHVSKSQTNIAGDYFSNFPVVSSNGHHVYFQSNAQNLVPNGDRLYRIFDKNILTGAVRVVTTDSRNVLANAASLNIVLDTSDEYLFFESKSTNLVGGVVGNQVFRKDLISGEVMLVSASAAGKVADSDSAQVSVSKGGRFAAFASKAHNLVSGSKGGSKNTNLKLGTVVQIYLKDLDTGRVVLVSSDAHGIPGDAISSFPVVSEDGKWVTFVSASTQFAGFENPRATVRIYQKNIQTGELIQVGKNDHDFDSFQIFGSISTNEDGRLVTFAAHRKRDEGSKIFTVNAR